MVGLYIVAAALPLLAEAVRDLLDASLPPDTVHSIEQVIEKHRPMVRDWHALRTRRAGSELHVDFHVVLCREQTLEDAHRVADHLEHEVRDLLGNATVVTHVDPCAHACADDRECERMKRMVRDLPDPGRSGKEGEGQ